jgi:hypothetical protein
MTAIPLVDRKTALKKRTNHERIPGMGYLVHSGPPDLPADASGNQNCAPPAGTVDGSAHVLKPPGGAKPMRMVWIGAEKAWAHPAGKGNRLAWPTDHLMRAGWKYVGPEKARA